MNWYYKKKRMAKKRTVIYGASNKVGEEEDQKVV